MFLRRNFTGDLDKIKKDFLEIKAKNTISLGDVDFTMFPPCIKTYITQMRCGKSYAKVIAHDRGEKAMVCRQNST